MNHEPWEQPYLDRIPLEVTPELAEFCGQIVAGGIPSFVPVVPHPQAAPNDCHVNVLRQVSEFGGTMVSGWLLFEDRIGNCFSVYHSVWKSPNGELIDVTSYCDAHPRILFLVDPDCPYRGIFRGGHAMIRNEVNSALSASLLRVGYRGVLHVAQGEIRRGVLERSLKQALRLFPRMKPCWCGSGVGARECCVRVLVELAGTKRFMIRPTTIEPAP